MLSQINISQDKSFNSPPHVDQTIIPQSIQIRSSSQTFNNNQFKINAQSTNLTPHHHNQDYEIKERVKQVESTNSEIDKQQLQQLNNNQKCKKYTPEERHRSQTAFNENRKSTLRENNMQILNTTMKIKIYNNRDRQSTNNISNELDKLRNTPQIIKDNSTQKIIDNYNNNFSKSTNNKNINNLEIVQDASELIMMKSLNESEFKKEIIGGNEKYSRQKSRKGNKAFDYINSNSPIKKNNNINNNSFLNIDFSQSQTLHKNINQPISLAIPNNIKDQNNNDNCNLAQDQQKNNKNSPKKDKNIDQNKSNEATSYLNNTRFGSSQIIKQGINNGKINIVVNEVNDERNNYNNNICDEEINDIQSFNTQNHAQNKHQTIHIQMKDLRFFLNSKKIIVVDLKNPQKIEELRKEKTMKDWFIRRKSQVNNKQIEDLRNQNHINPDINIPSENQNSSIQPNQKQATSENKQPEQDDESEVMCKICFEGEDKIQKDSSENNNNKSVKTPLLSPCLCQGSMKYIHEECLKEWIISKLCQQIHSYGQLQADLSQIKCEICKYTYRMEIKLGNRFLPKQAIQKGVKPLYLSIITFLIACMLFYLTVHFIIQSFEGSSHNMETGYSLGIGVCSCIVGCVFLFISIICLKECLYVKKIVSWIIFNSERQKKIDSLNNSQYFNYNGFRVLNNNNHNNLNNNYGQQQSSLQMMDDNIGNIDIRRYHSNNNNNNNNQQLNETNEYVNQTNEFMNQTNEYSNQTNYYILEHPINLSEYPNHQSQTFYQDETQNMSPYRQQSPQQQRQLRSQQNHYPQPINLPQ